jgi:hippurate hydrolase
MASRSSLAFAACCLALATACRAASPGAESLRAAVAAKVESEFQSLLGLYTDLHRNPELSLMEERTAGVIARELRAVGAEVTTGFGGGYGVVGVMRNGPGPVVLLRADLDGLPVQEETGLPYASTRRTKNLAGQEVPVMHACGHDVHMTCLVGAARALAALKERWSGTLVLVGQPAEETGVGARVMLAAGLYRSFPKPDFAIALHDSATLPAGTVGVIEGFAMANVDSVDITVRGIGGHGAYPHTTRDPVVLAARIVLALQTIVSRENRPIDPVVITVGSIHGGTKHNIIPDEVKLQLTVRSYADDVRARTLEAIRRVCRGEAIASGLPEDRMPLVTVSETEYTPATFNDPALTRRLRGTFERWLGAANVKSIDAEMGGEDFGRFGRTTERVPISLFRVGAVAPEAVAESTRTGRPLPSLHSSKFAPVPEPTLKTGVTALTAAALELLGAQGSP